jgi:hypothetical protein
VSAPEDTAIPYTFGSNLRRADGKRFGYQSGLVAGEIDETGARVLGALEDRERLEWSAKKGAWEACARGECRPLKH